GCKGVWLLPRSEGFRAVLDLPRARDALPGNRRAAHLWAHRVRPGGPAVGMDERGVGWADGGQGGRLARSMRALQLCILGPLAVAESGGPARVRRVPPPGC